MEFKEMRDPEGQIDYAKAFNCVDHKDKSQTGIIFCCHLCLRNVVVLGGPVNHDDTVIQF